MTTKTKPKAKGKPPPPSFHVEQRHIDTLIPHARNPRVHSPVQVEKLASLMKEYGWTSLILLDGESGIIAGHGRIMAARLLLNAGVKSLPNLPDLTMLPCADGSHLTPAQRIAFMIADNRIPQEATWDPELLAADLQELEAAGLDLSLTALSEDELRGITSGWQEAMTNPTAKDGAHTQGVSAFVRVAVPREREKEVRELIGAALKDAGIEHELG